jgi:hypothetical protein
MTISSTMSGYQPLYPPESGAGPPFPLRSKRKPIWDILRYIAGALVTIASVLYLLSLFGIRFHHRTYIPIDYEKAVASTHELLDHLDPSSKTPGTFFRDSYPIRTALAFWDLAEREVEARGLDTCSGQLSRELIEGYHETQMTYCAPAGEDYRPFSNESQTSPNTYITCTAVHRNDFTRWWPYPAAPCISSNIRFAKGEHRAYRGVCSLTGDGNNLLSEMAGENFVGSDLQAVGEAECRERIDHTVMVIKRQDQWNP